jgi:hypothetical protein
MQKESPVPRHPKPLQERFWAKVDKASSPNGCWLWTGATGNFGYGVIGRGRRGEGTARAHVLSYEWANGLIPVGMVICHACDTPACVNPAHLFAALQIENVADMNRKGRGVPPPHGAGDANPAAKLDFLDVALVRTLLDDRISHRHAAKLLGVSKSTITRIANNQSWAVTRREIAQCQFAS